MCWLVLAFFGFVLVLLTREPDTLPALLVTPVWFLILGVGWFFVRGRTREDGTVTEGAEPSPR